MYSIPNQFIIGRTFYADDKNITYTCIGHGEATGTGRLLFVGQRTDPTTNESTIRTFRDNDVTFLPATP
jgi:hypothetical protein